MKVGDIVDYRSLLWKVSSRNKDFGTFVLVSFGTERVEVPADEVIDVVHSTVDWPFIAAPPKSFRMGRFVAIKRNGTALTPFLDWVPSDIFRAGGAVFFNPGLGLKYGDVLVGVHENGGTSRLTVTRAFGSAVQRKKRKTHPWKPPAPKTVYDRLMSDDDIFGELGDKDD